MPNAASKPQPAMTVRLMYASRCFQRLQRRQAELERHVGLIQPPGEPLRAVELVAEGPTLAVTDAHVLAPKRSLSRNAPHV